MFLIYLILTIAVIAFLVDVNKNPNFQKCKRKVGFSILLLFHHLVVTFLMLGVFSSNKRVLKVYAFTVAIILISWFIYNHHCLLSYYTNKMCDLPLDTPHTNLYDYVIEYITKKPISISKERPAKDYTLLAILVMVALFRIGMLSKKK
jgi:hypothetical protein